MTKKLPKSNAEVSVVIPCYNLGIFLSDAIGSVRRQSYKNYEIIVVDDGSTDEKTVQIVDKLRQDNPDITFIMQQNMGLSEARNSGIKVAVGKYIVCLDADDILEPEYIKKTVAVLKKDKSNKLGFVTTWLQEFGERENIWQTSSYNPGRLLVENVAHAGSMFKKQAWAQVGGYKKEMKGGYEDWEFWVSLMDAGYQWDTVPEILFAYRIRPNSMFASASDMHLELYGRIVNFHQKLYSQYATQLASWSAQRIHNLRAEFKNEIDKRDDKIQSLYKDRRLLYELQSSKIVATAIKIRQLRINLSSRRKN